MISLTGCLDPTVDEFEEISITTDLLLYFKRLSSARLMMQLICVKHPNKTVIGLLPDGKLYPRSIEL